jgi:hypothetical protein
MKQQIADTDRVLEPIVGVATGRNKPNARLKGDPVLCVGHKTG